MGNTMRISTRGLDLIKSFESFVPYVYDDLRPPKGGRYAEWEGGAVIGTLTIGYGHTNAAKHPLKITKGLRITEAEAVAILDVDLDECEEAVNRTVTQHLSQGQFDALVSFAFNCGLGSLENIVGRINIGNWKRARAAIGLYTKSKGRELAGLVRRRKAEQALWDGTYPTLPDAPVHHPAEVDDEPRTPPPPDIEPADAPVDKPPASARNAGAGAVVVAAGGAAAIHEAGWGLWEAASIGLFLVIIAFTAFRVFQLLRKG